MGSSFKVAHAAACLLIIVGCKKELHSNAPKDRPPAQTKTGIPKVEWTLELTGSGLGKPMVFTFEQLARMEMTRLDNVLMMRTHEADKTISWEGPSLEALLAAAEIRPGPMRLRLEAQDGYGAEATLDDLKSAIVALKDGEGRWLTQTKEPCPVRLIPPTMPGNYWVMCLNRITVEPLAGPSPSGD